MRGWVVGSFIDWRARDADAATAPASSRWKVSPGGPAPRDRRLRHQRGTRRHRPRAIACSFRNNVRRPDMTKVPPAYRRYLQSTVASCGGVLDPCIFLPRRFVFAVVAIGAGGLPASLRLPAASPGPLARLPARPLAAEHRAHRFDAAALRPLPCITSDAVGLRTRVCGHMKTGDRQDRADVRGGRGCRDGAPRQRREQPTLRIHTNPSIQVRLALCFAAAAPHVCMRMCACVRGRARACIASSLVRCYCERCCLLPACVCQGLFDKQLRLRDPVLRLNDQCVPYHHAINGAKRLPVPPAPRLLTQLPVVQLPSDVMLPQAVAPSQRRHRRHLFCGREAEGKEWRTEKKRRQLQLPHRQRCS